MSYKRISPMPVAEGGTGASTLTGLLVGAGTSAITVASYTAPTSWTPVLQFGGGDTGITYSSQVGSYTRIGNLVYIQLQIVLTNKGSSTGAATIVVTGPPASGGTVTNVPFAWRVAELAFVTTPVIRIDGSTIYIEQVATTTAATAITDAGFENATLLQIAGCYLAA